jgi:hypothetical protein
MRSAILSLLTGDPECETEELSSSLDTGLPAADVETTAYLDGQRIAAGTLAGHVTTTEQQPIVADEGIFTERAETETTAVGDFHADLEAGWAGITTGDIEPLLESYLVSEAGVIPEDTVFDLDAFAEHLPDDVETNGIVYSTSVDSGQDRDAAGSHWQRDAQPSKIPAEGTSVLQVTYTWDGILVDAMLAQSGYVAVYKDWTAATFARWVSDEIQPFLEHASDEQATLNDSTGDSDGEPVETDDKTSAEVCEACGKEPAYELQEASDGRMVCVVCQDDIDNRGEA